jgi:mono/diheme cytochrome c family protein
MPLSDTPPRRRAPRWAARAAAGLTTLLLAAVAAVAALYALSERRLRAHFAVPPHTFVASADTATDTAADTATVARGRRLATVHGCTECHGVNLGGRVVLDAPLVGRIAAPNLSRGGRGAALTDTDWERAVRHGVRRDGSALRVMPSQEFAGMPDDELAAIVAYARALPPMRRATPGTTAGPLGRLLLLTGALAFVPAERIVHTGTHPARVPPSPTAGYGAYLATGCVNCHGAALAGGPIPGAPPAWPPATDLTPAGPLARWTQDDFVRALREGRRPDGTRIRSPMPIGATRALTDVELAALWAYLRARPAPVAELQ